MRIERAHSEMDDTSNENHWYLARDGKRYGPVGEDDLRRMYAVGKIKPTDHLWRQGFTDWQAASDMSDFFAAGLTGDVDDGPRLVRRAPQEQEFAEAEFGDNTLRAEPLFDRPELGARHKNISRPVSEFAADLAAGETADPIFPSIQRYQKKHNPLRTLAYVVTVLIVLLIGALVALPMFLPADLVRDQIIALVKSETGRDLIVRGETKISAIPNLGIELRDVTLANPSGVAGDPLLSVAEFDVRLKILPLLAGRVEFAQIILKDPVVALRIDRESGTNWSFKRASAGVLDRLTAGRSAGLGLLPDKAQGSSSHITTPGFGFVTSAHAARTGGENVRPLLALRDPRLGDVRVINGTLTFSDERTRVQHKVEDINFSVGLYELVVPVKAEGEFKWRSEKILLKVDVETPQALIDGLSSPLKLTIGARHGAVEFAGKISLAGDFMLNGNAEANITSLRSMSTWFGSAIPPGAGFGPMSCRSVLKVDGKSILLKNAALTLDGMNAQGTISADLSKKRPHIKAELTVDQLDFNPYLGRAPSIDIKRNGLRNAEQNSLTQLIENINMAGKNKNASGPEKTKSTPPTTVEDRLVTATLDGGESDLLNAADADITLSVSQIFYEGMKVGKSRLIAKLKGGDLTADIKEAKLYDGMAKGKIEISGSKSAWRLSTVLDLENVSALPFLKDAADFDWISGRGAVVLDMVGVGATRNEVLANLQGSGKYSFSDGALEGINIPQMVRAFKKGQLSNWSREERLKTDFSLFTANFAIDKGVAKTEDINFEGPLLRINGTGTVNFAKERLDLRLRPKLVANLDGQAGGQNNSGLDFPLRITGSWHKPNISPDLKGVAEDPETVSAAIKRAKEALGGKLKEKNFEDLIRNILGNDGSGNRGDSERQPAPPKEPAVGEPIPRAVPQ